MNSGLEKPKPRVIQIEVFQKFLEDIPEYKSKLKAWDYLSLSTDNRNRELLRIQTEAKVPPNKTRFSNAEAVSFSLNKVAGFPLTDWKESPLVGAPQVLIYKNTDQFAEYCEDILDKNGELLLSREMVERKAA